MKSSVVIIVLIISSALCLPRQEGEKKNEVALNEPLNDPEIRRTLLRVFSESLRAAALSRVPRPTSASNVPVEEIIDLSAPSIGARTELGFSDDQNDQELLLLSDPPRSRTNVDSAQQRRADTSLEIEQRGHEGDELVSFNFNSEVNFNQNNGANHGPIDRQSTSENETRTMNDQPKAPSPSPAPPSPVPTLAAEEITSTTQLSPADKRDVQRFVSAVRTSNSTDEKLGDDVELFRAPLIAAFALQQDGDTGRTRSLYALPVARGITEELLKAETQTLSVAGQIVGSQNNGIIASESTFRQPQFHNFGRTQLVIQPSLQSNQQFSQFTSNPNSFLNNEVDPLREIERRQQELQAQLLRLQRERSALIFNRNTRAGENLQSSASEFNNVYRIPNYLQPPFF